MMRGSSSRGVRPAHLLAAVALAWCAQAPAAEQPLWELGVGAGAIAFEDYRGSGTAHAYPLPVPYFVYNGTFLKADHDGVRGELFNQPWVEINLSGNATTPVRNDRARSGMPDLKPTLEAGPSLDFHLLKTLDSRIKVDLRIPLRAAIAVGAPTEYIGWTANPRLTLDVADPFGLAGWNVGALAGPLFQTRRYDNYFYTVAPEYAIAGRPAYAAPGGYAGAASIVAVSKRYPRYWVGAYARYDDLSGAVFDPSPLVQRNSYWSVGFGFAWILRTSSQVVEVPE